MYVCLPKKKYNSVFTAAVFEEHRGCLQVTFPKTCASRGVGLLVVALLKHYHWLSSGCLALIGQTSGKL